MYACMYVCMYIYICMYVHMHLSSVVWNQAPAYFKGPGRFISAKAREDPISEL